MEIALTSRVRGLVMTMLILLLGGCVGTYSPFDGVREDALSYNKQLEEFNNKVTLLNILRSYHRLPRHYTAISDIKGNHTYNAGVSLSGATPLGNSIAKTRDISATTATGTNAISRVADSLTTGISGAYETSPNYTVAILESQEFYAGIMKPIPLDTIALFVQQGWESQLLANLLLEDIVLRLPKWNAKIEEEISANKEAEDEEASDAEEAPIKVGSSLTYVIENEPDLAGWVKLADVLDFKTKMFVGDATPNYWTESMEVSAIAELAAQKLAVAPCSSKLGRSQTICTEKGGDQYDGYFVYRKTPDRVGFSLQRTGGEPDYEILDHMLGVQELKRLRAEPSNHDLLRAMKECGGKATSCKLKSGFDIRPVIDHLIEEGPLSDDSPVLEDMPGKQSFLSQQGNFERWVRLRHYFEECPDALFEFNDGVSSDRANEVSTKYCNAVSISLSPRSTDGVMYYVGEYARRIYEAAEADVINAGIRIGEGVDEAKQSPLFVLLPTIEKDDDASIWKGHSKSRFEKIMKAFYGESFDPECGVKSGYLPGRTKYKSAYDLEETVNGRTYFIPTHGNCGGRSLQVLSMLQMLLNLNKKSDDLPKAQLIQVQ